MTAPLVLPAFGPSPTSIHSFPAALNPDLATAQTLALMAQYAREGSVHPLVADAARQAAWGQPDARARAQAVFWWVGAHVAFRDDDEMLGGLGLGFMDEQDAVIRPERLLSMPAPAGDCDCQATLSASMLLALGIRAGFVATASDPRDPHRFSHVWTEAVLPCGMRLALDPAFGKYPGWETTRQYRRLSWPIAEVQ